MTVARASRAGWFVVLAKLELLLYNITLKLIECCVIRLLLQIKLSYLLTYGDSTQLQWQSAS